MSNNKKEYVIGIDLGTSNSVVSVMQGGEIVVIPNSEGNKTTPSVVGFVGSERKVGDAARRQAVTNAKNTVYFIKRFMGKTFEESKDDITKVPYEVVNVNNVPCVKIEDRTYTPQEISAIILQKMKKTAEDYLGVDVTKCVVSVPAHFDDRARQATLESGTIAGLEIIRLVNEPTAAILSTYNQNTNITDQKVVVYDLGGGTMDCSVVDVSDGVYEVLSSKGNLYLGGLDFNNEIINYLVSEFKAKENVDLTKDVMAFQRLNEAAEKAKIELSSSAQTEINLPYITVKDNVPLHLLQTLSKAKFEQLIAKYIDKTIDCCKEALSDAKLKISQIDQVVLVGGSSRIPAVQEAVEKFFGKKPNKSLNPDLAISHGASVQASILSGDNKDVLLLDIVSLSFGLETSGGVMTKLIEANTTIPTRKNNFFSTASDNQNSVEINVIQGERPLAKDCRSLGRFHLDGIMPAPRGVPQIEVTFDVDANGILTVTAKDKGTGKENNIRIENGSNLTKEEIERMKQEAAENEAADKAELDRVVKLNNADALVFHTEKQIKEFDEKLTEQNKADLKAALENLKTAHEAKNLEDVDQYTTALNELWHPIATEMYKSTEKSTEATTGTDEGTTQDAKFEEV